jgi:hypothetical protein
MIAMRSTKYDHQARPWSAPDSRQVECRVCGVPVFGYDPSTIRHVGEDELTQDAVTVSPRDLPAVEAAAAVVRDVLGRASDGAGDAAVADAIVRALYGRGALRVRVGTWRRDDHAAA